MNKKLYILFILTFVLVLYGCQTGVSNNDTPTIIID